MARTPGKRLEVPECAQPVYTARAMVTKVESLGFPRRGRARRRRHHGPAGRARGVHHHRPDGVAVTEFPYRYTATEGMYAGTTFVYPDEHSVISYLTDGPAYYFRTPPYRDSVSERPLSTRYVMTPEIMERFLSYPER